MTLDWHYPDAPEIWSRRCSGGLWRDRPRFRFSSDGHDGTDITLTAEPSSRVKALRPLLWLITLTFTPVGRVAVRRLKSMAETEPKPHHPSSGQADPVD